MDKKEVIARLTSTWADTPTGKICLRLAEGLLRLNPEEAQMLTYESMLAIVDQDRVTPELEAALTALTTSEAAILKAGGIFIDEDDTSSELSDEEFADVVARNVLVHPITGEFVDNPRDHVLPFFSLVKLAESAH
ncbi:hypothetical protein [Tabrizicola sp.]|uniref:hypothetical protein n=1 Tax=Tabrizicola sp. TaxID=2005166 RepID=UPI002FDC8B5C